MTALSSPPLTFDPSQADPSFLRVRTGVIVGLLPSPQTNELIRQIVSFGLDVIPVQQSAEVRQLAMRSNIKVVLLDVCFGEESGFLTCRKLKHHHNDGLRVVLRGKNHPKLADHADFVEADRYIDYNADTATIMDALTLC